MNVLENGYGERLDVAVHHGAGQGAIVVLLHGLTGHKDRPCLVALAEQLAADGLTAVRVSFSGNGRSEGRFEESTVAKQVEELGAVLDAYAGARIGVIGHSLGGAVAVLRAARDPRIHFLVTLAAVGNTAALVDREFRDVEPGAGCMWGDEACPLSEAFVAGMRQVSVTDAATRVSVPWLLVHGLDDDVVPPRDARDLCEAAGGRARLEILPGADHLFSGPASPAMVRTVREWLLADVMPRT